MSIESIRGNVVKLFRPVGLKEMELILDSDCKGFPPRLPEQPYFYPVLNVDYARQIAYKWNTVDERSGYVGFVTEFDVDEKYVENFEKRIVGASIHEELWVPADELEEFNNNIKGTIMITEAHYGERYKGLKALSTHLKDKTIKDQLLALKDIRNENEADFRNEVEAEWKMILLNLLLWLKVDYTESGLNDEMKFELIKQLHSIFVDSKRDCFVHLEV